MEEKYTLDDLEKDGEGYKFPDAFITYSKERAEEILKLLNYSESSELTATVSSQLLSKIVDDIIEIKTKLENENRN